MGMLLGRPRLPERMRTLLLGLALAGDLGLLGWFKYYGFFASNFATLSAKFGLAAPLPNGVPADNLKDPKAMVALVHVPRTTARRLAVRRCPFALSESARVRIVSMAPIS